MARAIEYLVGLVVVVPFICAIAKLAGGDRYKDMTSGKFEAKAKRVSGQAAQSRRFK
jgi:hypothetical protein